MTSFRMYGPQKCEASTLCFGTMQFGSGATETDSAQMYEDCRAVGINFFDTAYVYTDGRSEQILGSLIAVEREQIILVTKAGAVGGSSANNIRTQLETSLKRLDQDYTDIFFLHRFDEDTPLEETFEALAQLKEEGKFFHLGVSNFSAWQVMKAQGLALRHGFPLIELLQPMYNLVKRQAEVELLPMALSENLGVISYSPLGGGLLTGKYADKSDLSDGRLSWDQKYAARYSEDWMHKAADRLQNIAADAGFNPLALAVAWVAHHKGITAPIVSARNRAQLAPSLEATKINIDDQLYQSLCSLTPTPPPATDRLEEQSS